MVLVGVLAITGKLIPDIKDTICFGGSFSHQISLAGGAHVILGQGGFVGKREFKGDGEGEGEGSKYSLVFIFETNNDRMNNNKHIIVAAKKKILACHFYSPF